MPQSSVLIIDSDTACVEALGAAFQAAGVQVHSAGDGHLGAQMAVRLYPNVIILAVELPGVSGYSVCQKLKRTQQTADLPMVLISSTASAESFRQHQQLRTRAEHYLHKPVDPAALVQLVAPYLPDVAPPADDQRATGQFTALSRELGVALDAFLDNIEEGEPWGVEVEGLEEVPAEAPPAAPAAVEAPALEVTPPRPPSRPVFARPAPGAVGSRPAPAPAQRTQDLPVLSRPRAEVPGLQRPGDAASGGSETSSGQAVRGANQRTLPPPPAAGGSLRLEVNILMAQIEQQEESARELRRTLKASEASAEDLRQRLEVQAQLNQRLEARLAERDDELARLRQERDELLQRANAAPSEPVKVETGEQERAEARRAHEALALLQERWDALEARAAALEDELTSRREAWREEREAMAETQQRLSEMVAELERRAEEARTERDALRLELETTQAERSRLQREVEDAAERSSAGDEAILALQRANVDAQRRIERLEGEVEEVRGASRRVESQASRLDTLLTEQATTYQGRLEALQGAFEALTAAHSVALDNLRSVRGHAETLEERLFMASEVIGRVAGLVEQVTGSIQSHRADVELPTLPELEEIPQVPFPELPPLPPVPHAGAWRAWEVDPADAPSPEAPPLDAEAPSVEEPPADEPSAEEPPAEEPSEAAAEEAAAEEAAAAESTAEEPAVEDDEAAEPEAAEPEAAAEEPAEPADDEDEAAAEGEAADEAAAEEEGEASSEDGEASSDDSADSSSDSGSGASSDGEASSEAAEPSGEEELAAVLDEIGPISTLHIPPPEENGDAIEELGEGLLLDELPDAGLFDEVDAGSSAELMDISLVELDDAAGPEGAPLEPEPAPEEPISGSLKAAEDELDNALELFAFDALLEEPKS